MVINQTSIMMIKLIQTIKPTILDDARWSISYLVEFEPPKLWHIRRHIEPWTSLWSIRVRSFGCLIDQSHQPMMQSNAFREGLMENFDVFVELEMLVRICPFHGPSSGSPSCIRIGQSIIQPFESAYQHTLVPSFLRLVWTSKLPILIRPIES